MIRRATQIFFLATFLFGSPGMLEAVEVEGCQQPGGQWCLCISWESTSGAYLEIRCDDGDFFEQGGNLFYPGTMNGPGSQQFKPTPYPGTVLSGDLYGKVSNAHDQIMSRLWFFPDCQALFNGSPLNLHPAYLASEYVEYRNGEGVQHNGSTPCDSSSVAAWTKLGAHHPFIYVCNRMQNLGVETIARKLLHEILHVAGQDENSTSSVSPGDGPSPGQIDDAVREACDL